MHVYMYMYLYIYMYMYMYAYTCTYVKGSYIEHSILFTSILKGHPHLYGVYTLNNYTSV